MKLLSLALLMAVTSLVTTMEKSKSRKTMTMAGSNGITLRVKLPTLSEHGSSTTLQYHYRVWGRKFREINVHFLFMTQEGEQFTVTEQSSVTLSPAAHKCRSTFCSGTVEMDVERQFQEYILGMAVATTDFSVWGSPSNQNLQQFQVNTADQSGPQAGDTYTHRAGQMGNYRLILLARISKPSEAAPTTAAPTTSPPHTTTTSPVTTSQASTASGFTEQPTETHTTHMTTEETSSHDQAEERLSTDHDAILEETPTNSLDEEKPNSSEALNTNSTQTPPQLPLIAPTTTTSSSSSSSSNSSSLQTPAGLTATEATPHIIQLVASIAAGCGATLAILLLIVLMAAMTRRRLRLSKANSTLKPFHMRTNDVYGLLYASDSTPTLPKPPRTMVDSSPTLPRPPRTMVEDYGYIDPQELNQPSTAGKKSDMQPPDYDYVEPTATGQPRPPVLGTDGVHCVVNVAYSHHILRLGDNTLTGHSDTPYDYIEPVTTKHTH